MDKSFFFFLILFIYLNLIASVQYKKQKYMKWE